MRTYYRIVIDEGVVSYWVLLTEDQMKKCSSTGCKRPVAAKGMCGKHYQRARADGKKDLSLKAEYRVDYEVIHPRYLLVDTKTKTVKSLTGKLEQLVTLLV